MNGLKKGVGAVAAVAALCMGSPAYAGGIEPGNSGIASGNGGIASGNDEIEPGNDGIASGNGGSAPAKSSVKEKVYSLSSPDGKLEVKVVAGDEITYSVSRDSKLIMSGGPVSMEVKNDKGTEVWGRGDKVIKATRRSVDNTVETKFYRQSQVRDHFNELNLTFKAFSLIFRVYDDGAAYRFVSGTDGDFTVESENAEFEFADDWKAYIPYTNTKYGNLEEQFSGSFENVTSNTKLSEWTPGRLAFLPLTVDGPDGVKVCITESDLLDYPGMYLVAEGGQGQSGAAEAAEPDGEKTTAQPQRLKGVFAPYPKELKGAAGHSNIQQLVVSREDYIAAGHGEENFPWRVIITAEDANSLAMSDLVWLLATPMAPGADFSWVKPGKVAWDWWNDWNISGVDFKAGINNETYRYYIDFASKFGIEYVILDEGWSVHGADDLLQVVPEIDIRELVDYGKEKGVGIILWAGFDAWRKDIEGIASHYADMGVKGFKVDFFNRDDQMAIALMKEMAEAAARHHLVLDFHGAPKPTGLSRSYPNVLNVEGVHGLEQMKWDEKDDQPAYDATIPFTRQVAGPLDYTQGAMVNASKGNFRAINSEPMSMGTRCHQLALYTIFDSPLSMLCDSPTNYLKEEECTEFIAGIPVVWDETRAIASSIGEYCVIARRKGGTWYVGAITNSEGRSLDLDLSFTGGGAIEIFQDGANADRKGSDYKKVSGQLPADGKIHINLAPGGGWTAKINPSE